MNRTWWAWARLLGGAVILLVLVVRLGTGPFLHALRTVDGASVAVAAGVAALTTVCCAWRWSLVARGLGVGMPLPAAVAACYRSQFLNTTLPGGVLGDVHRAVRHGRDTGDVGRGIRAVAWERAAGQAVQVVLAVTVLLVLPSPVSSAAPAAAVVVAAGAAGVVLLSRVVPHGGSSLWARVVRTAAADLREGLLARRAWPGIVLASAVAVAGHVAMFMVAAHVAGAAVSPLRLLPLALLVLLAAGLPTNVAGWGAREGMAAWSFSVSGLSPADGLAVAVVYGVLVLVASLPGAGVLLATWVRGRPRGSLLPVAVPAPEGAAHG